MSSHVDIASCTSLMFEPATSRFSWHVCLRSHKHGTKLHTYTLASEIPAHSWGSAGQGNCDNVAQPSLYYPGAGPGSTSPQRTSAYPTLPPLGGPSGQSGPNTYVHHGAASGQPFYPGAAYGAPITPATRQSGSVPSASSAGYSVKVKEEFLIAQGALYKRLWQQTAQN
jgi:hypothetical protein